MTAIVSAYAKSVKLPKQKPLRCVYCTVVVGESTFYTDDLDESVEDWEPYAEMKEGPVCWNCIEDYERARAAYERDKGNSVRLREAKRGRRGMRNPLVRTPEEVLAAQMKQAEAIWKGLAAGKSQGHIARNLGIARSTVQKRIKKFGRAATPAA